MQVLAALVLASAALLSVYACSRLIHGPLRFVNDDNLCPAGFNDGAKVAWTLLIASTSASAICVLGGAVNVWRGLGWFTSSFTTISVAALLGGLHDTIYTAATQRFEGIPGGTLLGGLAAFIFVLWLRLYYSHRPLETNGRPAPAQ